MADSHDVRLRERVRTGHRRAAGARNLAAIVVVLAGRVAAAASATRARWRRCTSSSRCCCSRCWDRALWRVDPASQDVDQISQPPFADRTATRRRAVSSPGPASSPTSTAPTRQRQWRCNWPSRPIRSRCGLTWSPNPRAGGYRIYRNIFAPAPQRALGLPLGEQYGADQVSFEDRLNLVPVRYYYTRRRVRRRRQRTAGRRARLTVDVTRVITAELAVERGLVDSDARVAAGRRSTTRATPARHRLSRPRSARPIDARRPRVAVHRHRRAVLLRAVRHSVRQRGGVCRRRASIKC